MRRQFFPALTMVVVFTIVCGLVYPLVLTGVALGLFNDKATGSKVEIDGQLVGSSLLGQGFTSDDYFWPRPSAAGEGYDGAASGASNLGPTNPDLLADVRRRVTDYRAAHDLSPDSPVPVDAVTASGSGLDPHISVANARLQAARVATERGLTVDEVLDLVDEHTDGRTLGFLGEQGVNVLELNLAVDERSHDGS
jgi:potassium-transporting ATPase KdpC subunit